MLFYLFHLQSALYQQYFLYHFQCTQTPLSSMWICGCHCMDDLPINGRFRVWKSWRFILGSLILGLMSHTMSRRYKRPVIIFIVPGIIPLVPGGAAYQATRF